MDRTTTIVKLFAAFGKENMDKSIMEYIECTEDIPENLLELACKRAKLTCEYLPRIVEIIESAKSLAEASRLTNKTFTWDEAWAEIQAKMLSTPWGKTPTWSSVEIETAVNSFGWHNLQTSLEKDMPTVRAQIRGFYESACRRTKNDKINEYLLDEDSLTKLQEAKGEVLYLPDAR